MPDWNDRRHWLDYDSAVAVRYHGRRQGFIDVVARIDPVLSIVLGGAAFASIVADYKSVASVAALGSALSSAVSLSFGLSERARLHESLTRRWGQLRTKLAGLATNDEDGLQRLEIERSMIDAESPPQLTALSTLCENEEKFVRQSGPRYRVGRLQRSLASLGTFPWWKPVEENASAIR